MPRQDRAVQTRARILQAAATLIQESGYSDMSLSRVSDHAGVTKGALYFHFASKEALALALIAQQHETVRLDAVTIFASSANPLVKMMRLCEDLSRKLMTDPIVRAGIQLTTDSRTVGTPVRKPYEDWIRTFSVLAEQAVKEGFFTRSTDPVLLANLIIPCYTGIQLVSEAFSERKDLLERMTGFWELVIRATVPPEQVERRLLQMKEIFETPV
ncbi:TetR family transcriptional regulator [Pseudoclavibacter sp. AY1F1]|uniref:ScbR family autoregulator-binding transcription factor n=1 Tax=Pseudoclavibacter sp. AY1F1 TaxID=2080583 RepID=UPI000CE7A293|nr:ScbR family autoregulator-binding transcription factor [Pseudoclavibacter sp. AY1F1]PPF44854.1 TetR family transcriptional regulator [Pseudoclavibacter sp. AY1F1]